MDYMMREFALPCLWEGRQMIIREGPRVVAVAVITAVLVEMSRKEDMIEIGRASCRERV